MVKFLKALPRPTAVFAPMDGRARLVLDACQAAGLRVPEEIAVLGVDNDTLLCESTVPALSSIHTDGFRRGQIAAEMLDHLMQGRATAIWSFSSRRRPARPCSNGAERTAKHPTSRNSVNGAEMLERVSKELRHYCV